MYLLGSVIVVCITAYFIVDKVYKPVDKNASYQEGFKDGIKFSKNMDPEPEPVVDKEADKLIKKYNEMIEEINKI